MKVLVALTLCLALTTTHAGFLDTMKETFSHIGGAFTSAFHQVGQDATDVGKQLLSQATDQGKNLLGQTAQSLLLGTMNALQGSSTKRSLSSVTPELLSVLTHGVSTLDEKSSQFKGLFEAAMGRLDGIVDKITDLSPEEIASKVDSIVDAHNYLADHLLEELTAALTSHQKRNGFTDAMVSVGNSIVHLFTPHIQAIKNVISGTGKAIKQGSAHFAAAMKQSMSQIGHSLVGQAAAISNSTHAIINNGKGALSAMKDAMSSIIQQTLLNMQPHVQDIVNTGSSALGAAAGSMVQAVGQAVEQGVAAAVVAETV